MSKAFYFDGCSHTAGDELQHEDNRWASLVSKHYNAIETNYATGGCGNGRVLRHLYEHVDVNKFDHVFIMWSHPDRFELFDIHNMDEYNPESDGYIHIKPNRVVFNRGPTHDIKPQGIDQMIMTNKLYRLALEYYYDQLHIKSQQQITFYNSIFQAQRYLDAINVPYTMSFAFPHVYRMADKINYKSFPLHVIDEIHRIDSRIDWTKFIFSGNQAYMLWADENGFEKGAKQHPLEEANSAWADIVIGMVDNYEQ